VSKGKLEKFAEMETFNNVLQPGFEEVFKKDYSLKGKWNSEFFKNSNPITIELGCGKGEYTIGLAQRYPDRNFIGVDIKGARIWKGAKFANKNNLKNVGFIRSRIEMINSFFAENEVEEIWITFPDPQLKKQKKRLTSSRFLKHYREFIKPGSPIHLKTDNGVLYNYTLSVAKLNNFKIEAATNDLYNSELNNEILSIKTYYENSWLEQNLTSHYICFIINHEKPIKEPPKEER